MKRVKKTGEGSFASAKEYALRLLTYRQRSEWEINRKLQDKGYDDGIIALVVAFLKEYNFIDDYEFARIWVLSRIKDRPTGKRRVYSELIQKGIDRDIIDQYVATLTPEAEEQMATCLIERKCHKSLFDYKKLEGFLLRRGFNQGIVRKVLQQYGKRSID